AAASPVRSSSEAAWCCGRPRIAGTRPGLIVRSLAGRRPAASRAMMAAVISVTPARPVHGADSGVAYAGPAATAASQRATAHTPRTRPLTAGGEPPPRTREQVFRERATKRQRNRRQVTAPRSDPSSQLAPIARLSEPIHRRTPPSTRRADKQVLHAPE